MATISEIEKLERRCAENPHGLTFAPLAEAYRKHGELDKALEVLRAGRELHPDYIPASIVLGRCHLDRDELPEAERAFAHVLTLDPENVIALKALAELAEREGRLVQAERWLNLLLAVDSSNEDARVQLERLRAGPAAAAGPETGDADERVDLEPVADAGETRADLLGITVEHEEEITLTPGDSSDYHGDTRGGALPEVLEGQPEEAETDAELVSPVSETADPFAGWPERADADIEPSSIEAAAESEPEPLEAIAPEPDPLEAVAPEPDQLEPVGAGEDEYGHAESPDPIDPAADALEPVPDLMSELAGPAVQPAVYPTAVPQPSPVVTESMAELYLRQGHRGDALAIYRQLAERRPDDRRLASLVADLAAEVDAGPAPAPAYAAVETGGRSVAELLRGILAERLPAAPPAPERFSSGDAPAAEFRGRDEVLSDADDQGEPTRPAGDHLTLGAVFGEEAAAPPPAISEPDAPPPASGNGLSFDQFFGAPPAAEPDATRTERPPPTDQPDDLDQFHAWLQSLKR